MYLADQPINTGTRVLLYLEKGAEKWQIHELILSLEVLAIVPLNYRVLQLTDPIGVAVYFQHPVHHRPLLPIVAVGQHGVGGGLGEDWGEPLDGVNVYHALHVEKIYGDFYGVALANLVDRLNVWSVDKLGKLQVVEFKRILKLF